VKPFLIAVLAVALLAGGAAGAGAVTIPVVDTATYQSDLQVAGTALVKLGTTLEKNDPGAAIRRQAPSLRKLLFSFDRRMYAMSRYRLEDPESNAHRGRVARAGLALSAPMSNFLDAVLLGQKARIDRLAKTVLARLGAVAKALE
jgi:hypothetical protein